MLPEVLFKVGSFSVSSFGLFLAGAYLLGVFLFWRWGREEGFSPDDLLDLAILSSVAGLVGGKLLPWFVWGLSAFSWEGALGAGLLAFCLDVVLKKWSFFRLADAAALSLSFGQAVGFLGVWLIGYQASPVQAIGLLLIGMVLFLLRGRLPLGVLFFSYLTLSGLLLVKIGIQALSLVGLAGLIGLGLGHRLLSNGEWFKVKKK